MPKQGAEHAPQVYPIAISREPSLGQAWHCCRAEACPASLRGRRRRRKLRLSRSEEILCARSKPGTKPGTSASITNRAELGKSGVDSVILAIQNRRPPPGSRVSSVFAIGCFGDSFANRKVKVKKKEEFSLCQKQLIRFSTTFGGRLCQPQLLLPPRKEAQLAGVAQPNLLSAHSTVMPVVPSAPA
jgi:hypothetical protein